MDNPSSIFLKAEWIKLAIANYEVSPDILLPYLPKGTELDLWNNTCCVSLVGFMFCNTKVKGIKIPFHVNFEEVNLRFYVKYNNGEEWRRGVVFIKEIVPKSAITFIANTLYKEHYQTLPMKHTWKTGDQLEVQYSWKLNNVWNEFIVKANAQAIVIDENSEAEFITEHYWGYTKIGDTTAEYAVEHPRWEVYPVNDYRIKVDFGVVYGTDFEILNNQKPLSVFLVEGSEIVVKKGNKIK